MAFCSECGKQLKEGAKFCLECGTRISFDGVERKQTYDGEIHKCPNCGEVLKAFEIICPTCNFELRGVKGASAVKKMAEKLEQATSEKQKISIIENFFIPNTKEDIFEFMFWASSNFDASYYAAHLQEEDISDAWLKKIEQCYQKAKLAFGKHSSFKDIENLYINIKNNCSKVVKKERAKPFLYTVFIVLGLIFIAIPFYIIKIIGLALFVSGILLLGKKQRGMNVEIKSKENDNETRKTGFRSWGFGTKILWIILNIYTLGIPALIYISKKR